MLRTRTHAYAPSPYPPYPLILSQLIIIRYLQITASNLQITPDNSLTAPNGANAANAADQIANN